VDGFGEGRPMRGVREHRVAELRAKTGFTWIVNISGKQNRSRREGRGKHCLRTKSASRKGWGRSGKEESSEGQKEFRTGRLGNTPMTEEKGTSICREDRGGGQGRSP